MDINYWVQNIRIHFSIKFSWLWWRLYALAFVAGSHTKRSTSICLFHFFYPASFALFLKSPEEKIFGYFLQHFYFSCSKYRSQIVSLFLTNVLCFKLYRWLVWFKLHQYVCLFMCRNSCCFTYLTLSSDMTWKLWNT
jgi:hypothetical protein